VVGDGKNFWPKTAQDTDALLHRYPLQGDALRVTCRLAEIQEAGIQELARRGK
jgi:hypothetical protein